jgi:hypothetical protein
MLRPGLLCIVALASLLLLPPPLRGDEPPRVALRFHLRIVTPPPKLDEELPDLDEVLHPEASYLSDVPPTPPEKVPRWYGKTLLVADAASFGLMLTGAARDNRTLLDVGIAGMLLTGPIVHAWHGHLERGLIGVLMRFGAPFVVGWAGYGVGGQTGARVGEIAGYLGAVAFDGMYFCRDLVDEEDADEPGITPDVSIAQSGASVGLHGRF